MALAVWALSLEAVGAASAEIAGLVAPAAWAAAAMQGVMVARAVVEVVVEIGSAQRFSDYPAASAEEVACAQGLMQKSAPRALTAVVLQEAAV